VVASVKRLHSYFGSCSAAVLSKIMLPSSASFATDAFGIFCCCQLRFSVIWTLSTVRGVYICFFLTSSIGSYTVGPRQRRRPLRYIAPCPLTYVVHTVFRERDGGRGLAMLLPTGTGISSLCFRLVRRAISRLPLEFSPETLRATCHLRAWQVTTNAKISPSM